MDEMEARLKELLEKYVRLYEPELKQSGKSDEYINVFCDAWLAESLLYYRANPTAIPEAIRTLETLESISTHNLEEQKSNTI